MLHFFRVDFTKKRVYFLRKQCFQIRIIRTLFQKPNKNVKSFYATSLSHLRVYGSRFALLCSEFSNLQQYDPFLSKLHSIKNKKSKFAEQIKNIFFQIGLHFTMNFVQVAGKPFILSY